ncbi:16S rRNA (guanine(966)-N(2))-methyltransferase RsmD [bacterium]|nr:16S rRNA (guanine(966)-N(2))-methyltransferase RsmD [bacterium]
MIRIISGKQKGLHLNVPPKNVRPTTDFVKEAIFSMLFDVSELDVLDLYGGSGALGIECFSRGSKRVTIVENSKDVLAIMKRNISLLKDCNSINVVSSDVIDFLKRTPQKFDLIFVDPPYATSPYIDILQIIKDRDLLNQNGTIVFEMESKKEIEPIDGFEVVKNRKYGITRVMFYQHVTEVKSEDN